jgi:predicted nucleic acid-binding protein
MKPLHLDSSIVIPYLSGLFGTREDRRHPNNKKAVRFIKHARAPLKISVAVKAEVLRHFADEERVEGYLKGNFPAPLPLMDSTARRWARLQERSGRSMGDNDAWVAALAYENGGVVVGHDHAFEKRPGVEYIDFLKA